MLNDFMFFNFHYSQHHFEQLSDNCGVTLGQLSDDELWYHLRTTFEQFGTFFIHFFENFETIVR